MVFLFMGVFHATFFAVLAFFIFFAVTKTQGWLALFGKILGGWALVLAVAALLGSALGHSFGDRAGPMMMWGHGPGQGWGPGMMQRWQNPQGQPAKP